jgi:hypothetical protein
MKISIKLFFLLFPAIYFSQGKDTIHKELPLVKFNFKNPESIRIPSTIKEGDFYRIHIKGINLNRYRISLNASDTTYSKPLSLPTFCSIDLSGLEGIVSSSIESLVTQNPTTASDSLVLNKMEELEAKPLYFTGIFAQKNTIYNDLYRLKKLKPLKKDSKKELIEKQLKINKLNVVKFNSELEISKKSIDNKGFEYMEIRVLRKTQENDTDKKIDIKKDLKYYYDLREDLEKIQNEVKKTKEISKKFTEETPGIKAYLLNPKNITLKDKFSKSENSIKLISKKINEILKVISSENIEKMMVSVMNLYDNNEYKSLPIQFNEEKAKVELFFIPKDSSSNLQKYTLFPVKFPRKKSYWSVGTSMYYSGLKSERVGYKTIVVNDSVSNGKLSLEKSTNGELGTALLLRGGKKFYKKWGYHIAVGTGISISDEILPRALFGGGLSYGQKHNFTLDIGLSAGNVKEVSESVDFNLDYKEKPNVLINQLKTSYFFAVGYSFQL